MIKLINSSAMPIDEGDMFNGGELSVSARADGQLLNRVGRWPTEVNIWARVSTSFTGRLRDPRGKGRERHMWPGAQPCAERTTHERHQHAHAGRIDAERGRQRVAHAMGILRRVMDGERVAVPHRHGGKQADRVVLSAVV